MHLEILLQEQLISRRRLAAFAPGKVLPLMPEIIHCVEVRVNGQLLALGELVQLEDRLGVELHEVYQTWLPGGAGQRNLLQCFFKRRLMYGFFPRASHEAGFYSGDMGTWASDWNEDVNVISRRSG